MYEVALLSGLRLLELRDAVFLSRLEVWAIDQTALRRSKELVKKRCRNLSANSERFNAAPSERLGD